MIPLSTLTFTSELHAAVKAHLFPGDGREAVGLLLCSRSAGPRLRLLTRRFIPVPHHACRRRACDQIIWPGDFLEAANDAAEADGLAIMAIHSHPGGLFAFSDADDASDKIVMPCLFHAGGSLHGSAVMIPGGAVRARAYTSALSVEDIGLVSMAGDDIYYWWGDSPPCSRRPLPFTSAMTQELSRLIVAVIGVSGTGSVVAEQLSRLGFGKVILIDFDHVELKNLNRILNSRLSDAAQRRPKVYSFADAVESYRGQGVAIPIEESIATRRAVEASGQADLLFSCVDTLEARQIADLMGVAFLQPLFDVGVTIPVRKDGDSVAIADVCGRIDYVQPGGSTLRDRDIYTPARVRAEYLRRSAPEEYRQEVKAGYFKGVIEEAPAVITLNMRASSACVNEFIARAYPFRLDPNRRYARTTFSLAACEEEHTAEDTFSVAPNTLLARGDLEPLLGLPALKRPRKVAA